MGDLANGCALAKIMLLNGLDGSPHGFRDRRADTIGDEIGHQLPHRVVVGITRDNAPVSVSRA